MDSYWLPNYYLTIPQPLKGVEWVGTPNNDWYDVSRESLRADTIGCTLNWTIRDTDVVVQCEKTRTEQVQP